MRIYVHDSAGAMLVAQTPARKKKRKQPVYNPLYDANFHEIVQTVKYDEGTFDALPTVDLDLAGLASGQPDLDPGKLDAMSAAADGDLPPIHVVHIKGKDVLWDGNHRVNVALKQGKKSLPAKHLTGLDAMVGDEQFTHHRTWHRPECGCGCKGTA